MTSPEILRSLLGHFGMLSLLAVGGGGSVIPDMHRFLVEANGWMSDEQFAALYAISQASPGPNILFVALFGRPVRSRRWPASAGRRASSRSVSNTSRAVRRTQYGPA